MLTQLHIENIAVIEKADIDFNSGLNVLTGETGAGKSIIIDSLNAILGARVSKDLVRRGAETASVSAVFELEEELPWFADNDIEYDGELIIQRTLSAEGKSKCRVCGVPVSTAQLKALGSQLIDIHGQNDGLRLLDEKLHLEYLDSFGELAEYKNAFADDYKKFLTIEKEISSLSMDDDEKTRLSDSLQFQIQELEKAQLKEGEYDTLSARRDLLRNSEKLNEALGSALGYLDEGDESALNLVQNAAYFVERAARLVPELETAAQTIKEAVFSITDVTETLNDFRDSLDFSPDEYDRLESRIARIDKLSRKYSRDEAEMIEYLDQCRKKLDEIEYSGEHLIKLKKELQNQAECCRVSAKKLSDKRKASASMLEKRIVSELKELNMPSVRFAVEFEPVENKYGFNSVGCDDVRFIMSANAGEELGRISRIASGGELSRIMLALKNVFAEHDIVNTMVFDEIDTGVSGISAQRVAEKLYAVSNRRQVMCVTHLPQIASMADSQYLVKKSEKNGRTFTEVLELDISGRKSEIARLYGGDNITELTLAAAEEQMTAADVFKKTIK